MSITANNLEVRTVINQVVNDPTYKDVSFVPVISWHQIMLIFIAYTCVIGGILLHLYWGLSLWIVYPVMVFGFFTAFTPLHDATHRAVSSHNWLNDILGTISGFILFPVSNAVGYRYLHLAHHRYVGDKDLDPDEPMVSIPTIHFPWGYILLVFPDLLWAYWLLFKAWKRTPIRTRWNVLSMIVGNVLFHAFWLLSPVGFTYFILFFIPNRLAITYTAYTFAHTPHPEGLKWNDHPFQSTFQLKAHKIFNWSLYGQKHHAMHHFLPHIPWYKYFKAWDLANGVFQTRNIPEKEVFSFPDPHFKEKVLKMHQKSGNELLMARVTSVEYVARNVKSFTFEPAEGSRAWPSFSAGSHITLHLTSGKKRTYSCVNPPYEKNRYQIAVKLEENGRGGSKEIHEHLAVGDTIELSTPKNNFVLYENADNYILVSGGIGITPMLSMAHRLTELEKHFELHICVKSLNEVPFQFELDNWTFAPNVQIHIDRKGKSTIDINRVLADPNEQSLLYVCGPGGFNKWIYQSAVKTGWEDSRIKQELFSLEQSETGPSRDFNIQLHKSGKTIHVAKDQTIIDALHLNNIDVPYSCLQGTCGTCITKVIEGTVEHRDAVLSEQDKIAHSKMCLCVSRAKSDALVLDI